MGSSEEAVNQYAAAPGEVSREYDANGNLIRVWTTAGTREMAYDHGNRMVRFKDEAGHVTRCDYDTFGRRLRKTTHAGTSGEEATRFVHHGHRVIEERGHGGALRTFAWGVYIDELVNTRDGADQDPAEGEDHWYFTDHVYTVLAVVDGAGDLAERYEYADFGQVAVYIPAGDPREASAIGNRTLFTGREFDPESGYYHYRTRTYNPRDGRFTSIDSIGIWGDPVNRGNGYAYVGNRVSYHTDFDGRQTSVPSDVCRSGLSALPGHPRVNQLLRAMEVSGCSPPKVRCDGCCPSGFVGFFRLGVRERDYSDAWYAPGEIVLCIQNIDDVSRQIHWSAIDLIMEVLIHELIHALDDCDGVFEDCKVPNTNPQECCTATICSELRAYSYNCRPGGMLFDPSISFQDCVESGAAGSGARYCGGGANALAEAQALYTDCALEDYR